MSTRCLALAVMAAAGLASTALAAEYGTMQGRHNTGSTALPGDILGTGSDGGYSHRFWSGSSAAAQHVTGSANSLATATTVWTFCSDPSGLQNNVTQTYHMIDTEDAPYVSGSFNATNARDLNSIMLAAKAMGIVDNRGFLTATFQTTSASLIAIGSASYKAADWIQGLQRGIWDSLDVNNQSHTNATNAIFAFMTGSNVSSQWTFTSAAYTGSSYYSAANITRILGVDSNGSQSGGSGQDMVTMIPLPPSAYAGMGTLAAVLGMGYIRRRNLAAV